MLVYVADDDKDICFVIERQFVSDGFEVKTFESGQQVYDAFLEAPCDLIVTDVMMPELNGFEMCSLVRKISNVPIIIISANGQVAKRLQGYELGSDDYVTKPFSLKELSMKAKNMLKRIDYQSRLFESEDRYAIRDLIIKESEHLIYINNELMTVSEKEYNFLHLLIINKNKALSREFLIEKIWGYEFVEDTRLLDHVVKRIRKKLIELESEFRIETVWGFGYKVCD